MISFPTLARALVLAVAAAVLAWPLSLPAGAVAAALGAFGGALLGERAAGSALRLGVGVALSLAGLAAAVGLGRGWVDWAAPARWLGPVAAFHVGEVLLWFGMAAASFAGLRFVAARRPALTMLEVLAVAGAVATAFAAHRDGMVHRPLALGDWAWARGLDPVVVFLALGGVASLLLALLLTRETRPRRLVLHLGALGLVGLAVLLFVRVEGLPVPEATNDLGLTGDPDAAGADSDDGEGDPNTDGEGSGRGSAEGSGDGAGEAVSALEFRDEYGSSGSRAPVAVVLLHDDWSPPTGVYYFRQSAFSQFNGRRLVQTTRDDVDRDLIRRFPATDVERPPPPDADERRSLRTTTGLLVDHVRPFTLGDVTRLGPVPNPSPMRFQRTYGALSSVPVRPYEQLLGSAAGDPAWSPSEREHYLAGPADPRYAALATELLDGLADRFRDDPLARALVVKRYLDAEGIYSRRSRHADADDPAASFLFGDLTGYCVHFAHAAAYLLRSLDVPTRVASGYAVAAAERGDGSTVLVRGETAHAWPEIYLEGHGWTVVDPAPAQSLDGSGATGASDPRLQQMLGEMLRGAGPEPGQDAPEPFDAGALARQLVAGLVLLLVAGTLAGWLIKAWRRVAWRVASADSPRLAYRAALDILSEVGWRRRPGESPEALARRVAAEARPTTSASPFASLTDRHLEASLGAAPTAHGVSEALGQLLAGVEREARALAPRWRRALGLADPTSWWRSR